MLERLKSKRLFGLILIFVGGLILIASLGYVFFHYCLTNPSHAPLPESLAGFPLNSHSFGVRAVGEINQLHGLEFPLSSGAVGMYGTQGQAKLWISGSPNKIMAVKLMDDMVDRIAEGNSPFTPTGELIDNDRTVYALDGHGQIHYYYQSGKLIVWLAADADIADQALAETLTFYP